MLNLIVAAADNQVIGLNNRLPWYLPEDLRRFRELTMGHHVVMGRRTWESIGSKPLPGRTNAVVTRDGTGLNVPVIANLGDYIREVKTYQPTIAGTEYFIIGGAQIYQQALAYVERIYLTRVHWSPPGDTFFPMLDDSWANISREPRTGFTFEIWERSGA